MIREQPRLATKQGIKFLVKAIKDTNVDIRKKDYDLLRITTWIERNSRKQTRQSYRLDRLSDILYTLDHIKKSQEWMVKIYE